MNWNEIVEKVTSYVVKIETSGGHGTGFLCVHNENRAFCGITTAYHVVEHADQWQQPIRIHHYPSAGTLLLKENERVVFSDPDTDSAVILLAPGELKFPEELIPLLPTDRRLPIGVDVGWLGFPAIGPHTLCFFSGNVSAWQDFRKAYLIDGVSINGISGGPVIYSTATEGVQIVGTIAAYLVNRATGEALPGLSVAQDVSHFQEVTKYVKSIDEPNKKKQALEQAAKDVQSIRSGPTTSTEGNTATPKQS